MCTIFKYIQSILILQVIFYFLEKEKQGSSAHVSHLFHSNILVQA